MKPLDVNALYSRAERAFVAGRLDEARADLLRVQQAAGPHPAVLHLLAMVEAKRGAAAPARLAFEAALRLAPGDLQILNNFANFLAAQGDAAAAMATYERALAAAPTFHDARYNRALLLQKLGRLDEALAELDRVAAAQPEAAKVHSARGSVLLALGRLEDSAAAYDAALRIDPERATALAGRGRVALERGQTEAASYYRRALERRPDDEQLQLSLAEALEVAGDPAAIDSLAAAVASRPAWAAGHSALARMRWEAGEGRAFTRDIERALEASPKSGELWLAYASALAEADLAAEAADVAARGRAAVGDHPSLLLLEAVHASEAGQIERADRLFAAAPPAQSGRSIHEARHRIRCGDYQAALALVDGARGESPWDVGAWALTGLLWRLTGHPRTAWLLEQLGLVDARDLPLEAGQLDSIAARLRGLHRTRAHPIGQSLRGGTQTRGRLFERSEPEIRLLRDAIESEIAAYWQRLPAADAAHPLLRHRAARPFVEGSWSVRLTGGGFHISHFHPQGILSSACYFVVPEAREPMDGWLELGGPPWGLEVPIEPLARIEPKPGRMALFPSYLFHGTRRFPEGERLTVAFDVVVR